jgi:hypothetical protein
MPAPIVGVAAAAAARLIAKKLATKTVKKAVTSSARVRKNTNAVAGVAKPNSSTTQKTRMIQKNSVKKIAPSPKNWSGKGIPPATSVRKTSVNTLMADARKTVAVRTTSAKSKKLSAAQERAIEAERRFGPSRFDWR